MRIVYLLLISSLFFGCKKKLTQFYIDYTSTTVISSSVPVNTFFNIYTPEKETNSSTEFEVNDTRKDLIKEIFLEDLTIEITSPDDQDFDFLKSIEVFISSENLIEQKVAFKENIPNNTQKIECELLDVDLQGYIKEDNFTIRIRTITDQILTQDVELEIYTNFFVDAELI